MCTFVIHCYLALVMYSDCMFVPDIRAVLQLLLVCNDIPDGWSAAVFPNGEPLKYRISDASPAATATSTESSKPNTAAAAAAIAAVPAIVLTGGSVQY
jgi:hypothetical protein